MSAKDVYASTDSASTGRAAITRKPSASARSIVSNHRVVLPMPGSPSMTRAQGAATTDVKKAAISAACGSRLTTRADMESC